MKPLTCILLLSLFIYPMAGEAESLDSIFTQSNNAFWNGEYQKAATGYEKLAQLGVADPAVSYNLGTAHARLGHWGLAVLYYEKVLRLDPGHDDARHNLGVVREFLAKRASQAGRDADLAPAAGPWRAVLDRFSVRGAAIGFLVLHLCFFAVLIARRFVLAEMPRLSLGVVAGVLAILTITVFSVAVGKWHQQTYVNEAVVISPGQLDVMEGPKSTVKRFALEEGSRIRVLEERSSWIHILDSEGRDGWASTDQLENI